METVTQGTDDAARLAKQVEGLRQQLADTGLAIGARDADQMQATARLAIEASGDGRELARQALDRHQHGALGMHLGSTLGLVGDRSRAARDRIDDMYTAILLGAGHGQEQITRTHLAAVQRQLTNQHAAIGGRQQLIERHGHQLRPPCATATDFCASVGRLSGAIFIKRSDPAITRLNTGAEIRPP